MKRQHTSAISSLIARSTCSTSSPCTLTILRWLARGGNIIYVALVSMTLRILSSRLRRMVSILAGVICTSLMKRRTRIAAS